MKNSFKDSFVCSACGSFHTKWLGKCPDCNTWNSIRFEQLNIKQQNFYNNEEIKINSINQISKEKENRIFIGVPELDRVLGGGLVSGSLTLLSGDPGIGKSTLLLQALHGLARRGFKVLYASGEESCSQIKLRAERLNALNEKIFITNETNIQSILTAAKQMKPEVLVVDSIQTIHSPDLAGGPGNIGQIRECTSLLMQNAKKENISTFVIGHITKDGSVAGPKILEHLVDTVLYLEGDHSSGYRILKTHKNRFGSTGEIGVFTMQGNGLVDVPNPSSLFMNLNDQKREGSAISVSMEGSRPIFIEIQALVARTTFATPRRLATGFDTNRFTILLAVLEKRLGITLSNYDIYANITGGFKIYEPAIDLAIAVAVTSSLSGKGISNKTVFLGEISLAGEVRIINHALIRIQEAYKLGFESVFLPVQNFLAEEEQIKLIYEKKEKPFSVIPIEKINQINTFDAG